MMKNCFGSDMRSIITNTSRVPESTLPTSERRVMAVRYVSLHWTPRPQPARTIAYHGHPQAPTRSRDIIAMPTKNKLSFKFVVDTKETKIDKDSNTHRSTKENVHDRPIK